MRRLLLLLEWLFLLGTVVRGAVEDDIARLRVSIRKDVLHMVPSCQHSFSQVELLNLHSTEPIVIHNIQTAPEETVLLGGGSTPAGQVWEQDEVVLPQQVRVSRLPEGSLKLDPGQVALIPMTFLPHYPNLEEDSTVDHLNVANDEWSSPRLTSSTTSLGKISRTARVDLEDMIGGESLISESPTKRRGIASSRRPQVVPTTETSPEVYEVRTTILVETSRGVVKLPITASSVRHNLFGVPDVLYFETTSSKQEEAREIPTPTTNSMPRAAIDVMLLDTDIFSSIPLIKSEDPTTERRSANNTGSPDGNRECYDLYVTNPSSEREMEVSEIFVSKPELVTVEVKADEDTAYQNYRGHFPTGPSHVVRDWNQNGGPLILEPGAKDEYIATVCTALVQVPHDEQTDLFLRDMARWFEDKTRESSLGFAQIRTQTDEKPDTLVVHLELTPPKNTAQSTFEAEKSNSSDDGKPPFRVEAGDRLAPVDRSVLSSSPSLSISNDGDVLDLDEVMLSEDAAPPTNDEQEAGLLLQAMPSRADLRIVRTSGKKSDATARTSFGVRNRAPLPLRIMRATVGMNAVDSDKLSAALQQLGLQLRIRIAGSDLKRSPLSSRPPTLHSVGRAHVDSSILSAESVVDDVLVLSCSIQSNTSLVWEDSLGFSGLVVVRATPDTHLSYDSWREEMRKNPNRDSQFVIEIPYSIRVVQGRIDFVMEGSTHPTPYLFHGKPYIGPGRSLTALFFPLSRYNLEPVNLLDEETPYEGTHLIHIIRVISNMPAALEVGTVAVRDFHSSISSSICERFEVSHENKLAGQVREAWGLVDFGLITLRYFPKFSELSQPSHQSCFLEVTTTPEDTGVHRVELVLYSGEITVESIGHDSAQASAPDGSKHTLGWPSIAQVGFDPFLQWFQSTRTGASLRSLLLSRWKFHNNSDEELVQKYLGSLADSPVRPDAVLKPVFIQVGAIESGEARTAYLFLTNENPVPVVISIEVGEIEGLSISAGRDKARSPGDGNSVLDYYPNPGRVGSTSQNYLEDKVVPAGDWKGHPLKGLKQFLSSELPIESLQSIVPFRSAISASGTAIKKQPMLRSLYSDKGFVEFHSKGVPIHLNNNESSRCHTMGNETSRGKQGVRRNAIAPNDPILISDDGHFVTPLKRCWIRKNENNPVALEEADVVIPSGAVARFEIKVRAPLKSVLTEDITQFFASGLVLSNDHGEVLPILVTFEALQGQLHASHISTKRDGPDYFRTSESEDSYDNSVVDVEAQLFRQSSRRQRWQNFSSSLTIYPESFGLTQADAQYSDSSADFDAVPEVHSIADSSSIWLFLKSTFSRNVRLRVVQSCNPWFEVLLQDTGQHEYLPGLGTRVGEIRSSIDCDVASLQSDGFSGAFASFYQCAWKWLTKKSDLQPRGCGLAQSHNSLDSESDSSSQSYEANRAIRSLENAMRVLKREFAENEGSLTDFFPSIGVASGGKFNRKRSDGYVAPFVVEIFAEAWYSWKQIAALGLNSLTSSLTALIDCTSTESDRQISSDSPQPKSSSSLPKGNLNLTVSMQDISLRTSLEVPLLFNPSRIKIEESYGASRDKDELPSQLDFPPTLVGSVSSMFIPLRNPTSVPVKVRLATTSLVDFTGDEIGSWVSDGRAREQFLQKLETAYVQRGASGSQVVLQPWWDGGGTFYQVNDDGDLIESLHNSTIRAGTNAYVSVLSPSLHAVSAFLVGCGSRCGVRDDPGGGIGGSVSLGNEQTLSAFSPIGASSAAGVSLVGRDRSLLPYSDSLHVDEPHIAASGSLLPKKTTPAFAIPYSALDEIVLPPYGEATIGPIYFRPPGRYSIVGCVPALRNNITHWGTQTKASCTSGIFESLLFLENSLTGLERIVLRGSGLWSKIAFLDPEPAIGDDAFGNIDYRKGRPALIFSGSAEMQSSATSSSTRREAANPKPLPLVKEVMILNGTSSFFASRVAQNPIKEVVLANEGDVPLLFRRIYFSDSRASPGKKQRCALGSFRLLDCSDDHHEHLRDQNNKQARIGFELFPGESRSFYVEHSPDCSKRREFVMLNFEHNSLLPSQSSKSQSIYSIKETFRKGRAELLVGYEMSDDEFRRCKSPGNDKLRLWFRPDNEKNFKSPEGLRTIILAEDSESSDRSNELNPTMIRFLSVVSLLLVVVILSRSSFSRTDAGYRFWAKLKEYPGQSNAVEHFLGSQSNWSAAFRCLARLDPTSIELQGLGKEQVRQAVIGQYRALGALPPQCLSASGSFHRDRPCPGNITGRAKDGSGGKNERALTISDAIFCSYQNDSNRAQHGVLPAALGWRTAFSKGIISNSSCLSNSTELRTKHLLRSRRKTSPIQEDASRESLDDNYVRAAENVTTPLPFGRVELQGRRKKNVDRDSLDNTEDVVSTSDSESTQPAKENESLESPSISELHRDTLSLSEQEELKVSSSTLASSTKYQDTNARVPVARPGSTPKASLQSGNDTVDLKRSATNNIVAIQNASKRDSKQSAIPNKEVVPPPPANASRVAVAKATRNTSGRTAWKTDHKTSTVSGTQVIKESFFERAKEPMMPDSASKHEVDDVGSAHSPSSMKSLSSRSSNQSSTDASPEMTKFMASLLRPPPGIGPPPGFLEPHAAVPLSPIKSPATSGGHPFLSPEANEIDAVPKVEDPLASLSSTHSPFTSITFGGGGDLLPPSILSDDVTSSLLSDNELRALSPRIRNASIDTSNDFSDGLLPKSSIPELEINNELLFPRSSAPSFNVMDFLDNILNEGNVSEEESGGLLPESALVPVSSNPWAFGRQSRAAAYGINFEDGQQSEEESAHNIHIGDVDGDQPIPLLTPAAILSLSRTEADDAYDGSFFSSLLGE